MPKDDFRAMSYKGNRFTEKVMKMHCVTEGYDRVYCDEHEDERSRVIKVREDNALGQMAEVLVSASLLCKRRPNIRSSAA